MDDARQASGAPTWSHVHSHGTGGCFEQQRAFDRHGQHGSRRRHTPDGRQGSRMVDPSDRDGRHRAGLRGFGGLCPRGNLPGRLLRADVHDPGLCEEGDLRDRWRRRKRASRRSRYHRGRFARWFRCVDRGRAHRSRGADSHLGRRCRGRQRRDVSLAATDFCRWQGIWEWGKFLIAPLEWRRRWRRFCDSAGRYSARCRRGWRRYGRGNRVSGGATEERARRRRWHAWRAGAPGELSRKPCKHWRTARNQWRGGCGRVWHRARLCR